jgi:hypothetical protein
MTEAIADIIVKLVDALKKFLNYMTLGKLGMLIALMLLTAMSVAFWENRPIIYGTITAGDKFSADVIPPLSEPTKTSIKNIVDRHSNIVAVQILKTDFRNNVRDTVHFYSEIKQLQQEYEGYESSKINSSQIFQTGDTEQNERMIKIIEQEFVCVPVPDNILMMMPSSQKYAQQLCSISVPPRYGKMVGYINIWLSTPIDRQHIPYYKGLARSISDEVYDRDVM